MMFERYPQERQDCSGRTYMYKATAKDLVTQIEQMTEVIWNLRFVDFLEDKYYVGSLSIVINSTPMVYFLF